MRAREGARTLKFRKSMPTIHAEMCRVTSTQEPFLVVGKNRMAKRMVTGKKQRQRGISRHLDNFAVDLKGAGCVFCFRKYMWTRVALCLTI